MVGDTLSVEGDDQPGEKLIRRVIRGGARVSASPSLGEIRAHAARELERLLLLLRELKPSTCYPVELGKALLDLAAEFDHRFMDQERTPDG
jgi:nicotinate phosphoribosyltransferase